MDAADRLGAEDCRRNLDVWLRFENRHARLARTGRSPGQCAYHAEQRTVAARQVERWRGLTEQPMGGRR